jgi:hypothetical protein
MLGCRLSQTLFLIIAIDSIQIPIIYDNICKLIVFIRGVFREVAASDIKCHMTLITIFSVILILQAQNIALELTLIITMSINVNHVQCQPTPNFLVLNQCEPHKKHSMVYHVIGCQLIGTTSDKRQ